MVVEESCRPEIWTDVAIDEIAPQEVSEVPIVMQIHHAAQDLVEARETEGFSGQPSMDATEKDLDSTDSVSEPTHVLQMLFVLVFCHIPPRNR